MQTHLSELEEVIESFGGLRQIHSGYDALSWLLTTADADTIQPDGLASLLEILNDRLAEQLEALSDIGRECAQSPDAASAKVAGITDNP